MIDISYCFYGQIYFNQRLYWNTEKVENMLGMFFDCENYNQPIKFNLKNTQNIDKMFCYCENLNSNIILLNLKKIKQLENIFKFCHKLELKNINTHLLILLIDKYGNSWKKILNGWKINYLDKDFEKINKHLLNKNSTQILSI